MLIDVHSYFSCHRSPQTLNDIVLSLFVQLKICSVKGGLGDCQLAADYQILFLDKLISRDHTSFTRVIW